MQQHSKLSHVQHCDGSNASDRSVSKSEIDRCTLVRIIIISYYNVAQIQLLTCLKVTLIVPKLLLAIVILSLDVVECIDAAVDALRACSNNCNTCSAPSAAHLLS